MVKSVDNAVIIDGVLAAALLAGALIGAWRGLFKSLMGFAVTLVALLGAVLLANAAAPAVAEAVYPRVRETALNALSAARNAELHGLDAPKVMERLAEALGRFGVAAEGLDPAATLQALAEDAARSLVESVAHTLLLVLFYAVLAFVLKLAVGALDHVFDLPVLSTLNGVLGGALGLCEAALLLYVAVYAASHLGVPLIAEHARDTVLLRFFLERSPVGLIASIARKG